MKNKQLWTGFALLGIGIAMLFHPKTNGIAPFLVGFSVPTIMRGAQSGKAAESSV